MVRGTRRSPLWAALACVASACGSDAPTGPPSVAVVVVSPSPASVRVAETVVLSATPEDQAGNELNGRAVTWTSLNATVASVESGVVTGISEGTTDVSAVVDGTIGSVTVTVTGARVATVDVRPVVAQVLVGATIQMTATPRGTTGTALTGRTITWSSSDPVVATVHPTNGLVTGLAGGDVTITATVEQQLGWGDLGVIDPTAPRITSITPYPLIEGETGTLAGVNFGATPGANVLTVDGVAATVTAADGTSVTFTVPTTGCRPLRSAPVRVTAGGKSGTLAHPVRPAVFTQVGLGEQVILPGPGAPCLQFDASAAFESYLVGVQSLSESASSLSAVQVVSRTGLSASGASTGGPAPALSAAPATPATFETLPILQSHARRHLEARRGEAALLRSGALDFEAAAAGALQSAIPPNASVGQQFTVRVPPRYPGSCTQSTPIQAELRLITDRGHWLVDVSNLADSYSTAQLQQIADRFEDDVAPALEPMFGAIPDTDNNPRISFVVTDRVNQEGWLSYPSLYDYLPTSQCAASNEGDFLYVATPSAGTSFTPAFLIAVMGYSFAHDFTHVIQNRTLIGGGTRPPAWIDEGQAGIGEEVFAHRVTNRSARQNYGQAVIFEQIGQVQPYNMVSSIGYYFGFQGASAPKVPGAPEQCTWLDPEDGGTVNSGPCQAPGPSGGAWAFLRWLTDHYGAAVGGDGLLHQGLIDATGPGFDRVEALVSVPIETLLARFGAALYVDDRLTPTEPTLAFPSWNLLEFEQAAFPTASLAPRTRSFSAFTDAGSVRGGSTLYYRVSASGRPASALEVTGLQGAPLGSDMQVWVVRLQ